MAGRSGRLAVGCVRRPLDCENGHEGLLFRESHRGVGVVFSLESLAARRTFGTIPIWCYYRTIKPERLRSLKTEKRMPGHQGLQG